MHTTLALSALTLSKGTRATIGVLFLTLLAVEYGGYFLFRVARGQQPVTPFQQTFFRAGHAHAGVLVILSIVGLILADAAILMPAGFFFSAAGRDVKAPNRYVILLYLGIASLSLGVLSLGIGLLTS